MITEARIKSIEDRLNELTQNFLQAQKNQVPITQKVDETSNKVDTLTPYTETKIAYIDDTKVIFENVPIGKFEVYFDGDYTIERENDKITIMFEPLEEVKEVTISII